MDEIEIALERRTGLDQSFPKRGLFWHFDPSNLGGSCSSVNNLKCDMRESAQAN